MRFGKCVFFVGLLLASIAGNAFGADRPHWESHKKSLPELFKTYAPCCVRIRSQNPDQPKFFSGFFVSDDGYILTALTDGHLFSVETVWGEQFTAKKIGADPVLSVCLLKIDLTKDQKVSYFPILHLSPVLGVGDQIISLSCKLGQFPSPQKGQVTCFSDRCLGNEFPITYVRSNLPLEGGDSGGAVLDRQGNFQGMLLQAIEGSRESFYVPRWALERVYQDLLLLGEVRYGYAGISVKTCWDREQNKLCLQIDNITKPSPAQRFGFCVGDILTQLNGADLNSIEDLKNYLFLNHNGMLWFTVIRGTQTLRLPLKLEKRVR